MTFAIEVWLCHVKFWGNGFVALHCHQFGKIFGSSLFRGSIASNQEYFIIFSLLNTFEYSSLQLYSNETDFALSQTLDTTNCRLQSYICYVQCLSCLVFVCLRFFMSSVFHVQCLSCLVFVCLVFFMSSVCPSSVCLSSICNIQ